MKRFAKTLNVDNIADRSGFLWNMIGSAVYAITSMLLGTVVIRILGADAGGVFLFAFSTLGQHIYIISYFGMRPIQVTDIKRKYSFGDFRRHRIITCLAAFIAAVAFGILYAGITTKFAVIVIISLYKILDGLADCYESEYQRDGRLDMTGKSMTARTLFVVACFIAAMKISGNLVTSCIVAVIALAVAIVIMCMLPLRKFDNCDCLVNDGATRELFGAGVWLFISAFLDLYVFSASKYAIDASQSAAVSGVYSVLFIPTSVINLMANFIIRPVLTKLTENYDDGDREAFVRTCKSIICVIAVLTVLGMAAAYFIGVPVLGIFTGEEVMKEMMNYRVAFMLLILGGGFYALLNLLYYVLVIFGGQKQIFYIYVFGTIIATALCFVMAKGSGINGAAISYVICMAVTTTAFMIVTLLNGKRLKKANG